MQRLKRCRRADGSFKLLGQAAATASSARTDAGLLTPQMMVRSLCGCAFGPLHQSHQDCLSEHSIRHIELPEGGTAVQELPQRRFCWRHAPQRQFFEAEAVGSDRCWPGCEGVCTLTCVLDNAQLLQVVKDRGDVGDVLVR